ncbi:MAG: RNA ligase (ATP) [Clostridiales bacterium]|nr:RNA ligase (ATP) [Clostridiales bacterium]
MSSLVVEVCKINKVSPHKNADRLELAEIKGWQVVTQKNKYKAGDLVVFIPPDSEIPKEMAERLNILNYLAGKQKNRVKTVKLRGEISEGLIIPNEGFWKEGTDVAEFYEIEKFIPPIRTQAGDCGPEDINFMRMTDIENIKNYPNTFEKGQLVVCTEKLDGTQVRTGISQIDFDLEDERAMGVEVYDISEKDEDPVWAIWKAGSNKINRKRPETEEKMKSNIYWFPFTLDSVYNLVEYIIMCKKHKHVQLFGEIVGDGISGGSKTLNYGLKGGLFYHAFGMKVDKKKISYKQFKSYCNMFEVPTVPELAVIEYDFDKVSELAKGDSVLAFLNGAEHIKEGLVVTLYNEDSDNIAKFLNPEYILLKEGGKVKDFTDE